MSAARAFRRGQWGIAALILMLPSLLCAQAPEKLSPQARLEAARTVYVQGSGAKLAIDVISEAFAGWGRYTVVYDPAKADLIVAIAAPVSDSGVTMSGNEDGRATGGTRILNSSNVLSIRLAILDGRDRVQLWGSAERPKSSMKEQQRQENVIEAALAVFRRFRAQVEPEAAP